VLLVLDDVSLGAFQNLHPILGTTKRTRLALNGQALLLECMFLTAVLVLVTHLLGEEGFKKRKRKKEENKKRKKKTDT
jgi:hypothetical protein